MGGDVNTPLTAFQSYQRSFTIHQIIVVMDTRYSIGTNSILTRRYWFVGSAVIEIWNWYVFQLFVGQQDKRGNMSSDVSSPFVAFFIVSMVPTRNQHFVHHRCMISRCWSLIFDHVVPAIWTICHLLHWYAFPCILSWGCIHMRMILIGPFDAHRSYYHMGIVVWTAVDKSNVPMDSNFAGASSLESCR